MHLKTRNVNTAFKTLVGIFHSRGLSYDPQLQFSGRDSRNGRVIVLDEPVLMTYSHPCERVLFNQARDCNPFFHVYEALWMLAGRNDVASVSYYSKRMKDFSDDGHRFNGAYGYRWRKHDRGDGMYPETDQLDLLVNHLKHNKDSRRAVLQMWNIENDTLQIGQGTDFDAGGRPIPVSKDVCCNLSVMFSIRTLYGSAQGVGVPDKEFKYLDMTVTNRSNDMIWGMLGADYVDFVFLQEYMAAQLGCEVGKYNHFTNNLHVYDWNWKPEEWLKDKGDQYPYQHDVVKQDGSSNYFPLVKDPVQFEKELPLFIETFSGEDPNRKTWTQYDEPFFADVAVPMMMAFYQHKGMKNTEAAIETAQRIRADDWRLACTNWLQKRLKKENNNGV